MEQKNSEKKETVKKRKKKFHCIHGERNDMIFTPGKESRIGCYLCEKEKWKSIS